MLYLDLAERPAADSWEVGDDIVVDVDTDGHPVGIDMDQASRHRDLETLSLVDVPFRPQRAAG